MIRKDRSRRSKALEDALRDSEPSFRLILDGIPGFVAVMTATARGKVEFVNRQVLDYFDKTAEH